MKKNVFIFGLILVGLVVLNADARLFGRRCYTPCTNPCVSQETTAIAEVETKSVLVKPVSATRLLNRLPDCPKCPDEEKVDENPLILQQANEITALKAELAELKDLLAAPEPTPADTNTPWLYVIVGLVVGGVVTLLVKFRDLKYGK